MQTRMRNHEFARHIAQKGWTEDEVAERVNAAVEQITGRAGSYDANHIGKLKRGVVRCPHHHYRLALEQVFGVSVTELGFSDRQRRNAPGARSEDGQAASRGDEDVQRRDFLSAVAAAVVGVTGELSRWLPALTPGSGAVPARIGPSDVARLRAITEDLSAQQNRYGGCVMVDATCATLGWSAGLLRADCEESTRDQLLLALTELGNVAGWACHDAGQQTQAHRYFSQALAWAKTVDTPQADSLAANVTFGMGRVALQQRDPKTALRLVQLGQIAAQDAGDLGEAAQLHATAAWAYALMGQRDRVNDSLARAQHEMSRVDRNRVQPWSRIFFSTGDFLGHTALVNGALAAALDDQHTVAQLAENCIELTSSSLSLIDETRPARSVVFDRIVLSTALFRVGAVDDGIRETHRVLEQTSTIRSARAVQRLTEIQDASARFARTHSAVGDLQHELASARAALPV
ncbi:hypothetical protein AB0346_00175 [Nocardia beijingensis]|uniref:hypothetical protein n=1 Tax=Nocardia beijingensis TaxID=95162 RepID=UPI00344C9744